MLMMVNMLVYLPHVVCCHITLTLPEAVHSSEIGFTNLLSFFLGETNKQTKNYSDLLVFQHHNSYPLGAGC